MDEFAGSTAIHWISPLCLYSMPNTCKILTPSSWISIFERTRKTIVDTQLFYWKNSLNRKNHFTHVTHTHTHTHTWTHTKFKISQFNNTQHTVPSTTVKQISQKKTDFKSIDSIPQPITLQHRTNFSAFIKSTHNPYRTLDQTELMNVALCHTTAVWCGSSWLVSVAIALPICFVSLSTMFRWSLRSTRIAFNRNFYIESLGISTKAKSKKSKIFSFQKFDYKHNGSQAENQIT